MLDARCLSVALPDRSRKPLFGSAPLLPILRNVSLSVATGEAVGIVGESGSGKSTLGRALLRLYRPQGGQVVFEGRDLVPLSERELKPIRLRLQMIFQDSLSALNPRQKILDVLCAPLIAHRIMDTKAAHREAFALLERVGMKTIHGQRYPHELSGGQRQRVGIARALSVKPSLIVADEIVSGLDVSVQAQIIGLLRELLAERHTALLFISHDLSVVRTLCKRIAVMQHGEIVETGESARIFDRPAHPYTRSLLRAIPLPVVEPGWLDEPETAPLAPCQSAA